MTGLKSAFARIHNINADPEMKFAAAMVAAAAEDARNGDCQAYQWLESPCALRWLVAIVPMDDDCERVRDALLDTIPEPADCKRSASGTFGYPMQAGIPHGSASEMASVVVQLELTLPALEPP